MPAGNIAGVGRVAGAILHSRHDALSISIDGSAGWQSKFSSPIAELYPRVHDGLVRRADDALLLGAVLGKYAPQSRDLGVDVAPALPSRAIEPQYVPRVPGAEPELHCQQTFWATRAFFQA